MNDAPRYSIGSRVRLRVDASQVGVVVAAPESYASGWTYKVFFGPNDERWVNENGLEPALEDQRVHVLRRSEFLRALLAAKLESPLSDVLYSYQASRTQFEPYQFKPVLKYIDAPVDGILIADEVGLGKTIEAAILYQELKARTNISRVLVICPAGLRLKWRDELLTRFDESFAVMRRPDVLDDLRLYEDMAGFQPLRGIVGLETIRARQIQEAIQASNVRYDLVIIDEAHHLRTAGRLSNDVGELMATLTDNLVLLTATPLQTSQQDLFNLLRFIDESQFPTYEDFLDQLEPNQLLNAAIRALRERPPDQRAALSALDAISRLPAATGVTSHPDYGWIIRRLGAPIESREERVTILRAIDRLNVLGPIYTRTRKRDVSGVAKREAHVIAVPLTEAEEAFYQAVLAHARAQARAASGSGWIPGFAGMMRERQAASCLAATRDFFLHLHRNASTRLEVEASDPDVVPDGQPGIHGASDGHELERLLAAAARLGTTDTKFEMFVAALREVLAADATSKVIVFSYFRRTLTYLQRELGARGVELVLIHGDIAPADRARLIDEFRERESIHVLLTSEVGSEGLDFQFADTLFNYDLPWNPMRVEQRIGRIDRYGQKRDKVRIYSFFLQGTIEERILERLYERIGIFEDSIGDLEPILGPLSHELTKSVFTAELTPAEELELAERFADRVAFLKKEQEDLQERQAELLGQDALLLQAVTDTIESGRYVSKAELRAVVEGYLEAVGGTARLTGDPADDTAILYGDPKLADRLDDFIYRSKDHRAVASNILARLNRETRIAVTFDGQTASRRRVLEFLNLRHPLVQAAVQHERSRQGPLPVTVLAIGADAVSATQSRAGDYRFAIVRLQVTGAQSQTTLRPIVFDADGRRDPGLEASLLRQLQENARDVPGGAWSVEERDGFLAAARRIASMEADRVEADARDRNDALLAVREATIRRTLQARITKRRAQLAAASDERIQRMRSAEVRNLEADLQRRLDELASRREVSVSFQAIAAGRILVSPGDDGSIEVARPDDVAATPVDDPPVTEYPEPPPVWTPNDGGVQ